MFVNFERASIAEAHTADAAYGMLEQLVTGELPLFITRQARSIGYDFRSEQARAILAARGLRAAARSAVREMGLGRRHDTLGLHADGFVRPDGMMIHHHETLELAPGATSSCTLIRAKRDKPSPMVWGGDASRWRDFISMESGELDSDMLFPVVYHAELELGDSLDFCASGPITMVHQFSVEPPYSNRTISVTQAG